MATTLPVSTQQPTAIQKLGKLANNVLTSLNALVRKIANVASQALNVLWNALQVVWGKAQEWGSFALKRGSELLSTAFELTKSGLGSAKVSLIKTAGIIKEFLIENKKEIGLIGAGASATLALVGIYNWITGSGEESK